MSQHRPTIALDFDGVIHLYTSPWTSPLDIHDGPVPGAFEFMQRLLDAGWRIVVHTARLASGPGSDSSGIAELPISDRIDAILAWFDKHGFHNIRLHLAFGDVSVWYGGGKPHADVYLDDRGMRFEGTFPTLDALVVARRTWNK